MSRVLTATIVGWIGLASTGAAFADGHASLVAEGEQVFGDVCFACHGMTDEETDRIAPPVFAVKNRYSKLGDREDFVAAVSAFAFDPSEEMALMKGAIGKFGMMPNLGITKEEALAVAEYLFATDFSLPDWAQAHMDEKHSDGADTH